MNRKDQISGMRKVLIARRTALRSALSGDLSLSKDLKTRAIVGDLIDQTTELAGDEFNSQMAEIENRELAKIDHALELIKKGQFGVCEICKTAISMARLNALPYATLCIKCARAAESNGANHTSQVDWSRLIDDREDKDLIISDLDLSSAD